MTADRNNFSPHDRAGDWSIEPLPVEFEQEMIEVDRLIAHAARADAWHVPQGLAQRVFEMSVSSLPSAQAEAPALKLVGAETGAMLAPQPRRFAAWTQLALAASVLLAAGVTLWMTWPQGAPTNFAQNSDGSGTAAPNVSTIAIDLGDLNQLHASNPSAFDSIESEFSYLLDASEVRSFNDINDDLVLLVQELEM